MPTSSEESIFYAALQLGDATARDAYLADVCGPDADLRRRVTDLLLAYGAGEFLEAPVADLAATALLPGVGERPGDQIGPYKLLEQIGEGGMGLVFMAEQTQPLRRRVALKIIKPGLDTRAVIARFEAERQALALMDHPNIARVYDAGATDSGRPYFVMELVRGAPITDYCDHRRLSVRERLLLFVDVCRAVQHAHQKGVIHRDLKPSNILVTVIDDVALPKVIDFGVAKATGPALIDRTLVTGFYQFIGTPLYMSPEQAELSGVDVDTRSDIYSLGVLLYELLTGTTPLEDSVVRGAGLDEMRRLVCDVEPQRPSDRLSTLNNELQSTVSDRRRADSRQLGQSLEGELDWIVMKALDKDRKRRYETADAFAIDVDRYLRDEPVEACPPSARYLAAKFARRHRRVLATLAAIIGTLVVGMAASLWQAIRATRAEQAVLQVADSLLKKPLYNIRLLDEDQPYLQESPPPDATPRLRQKVDEYEMRRRVLNAYEQLIDLNPDDRQVAAGFLGACLRFATASYARGEPAVALDYTKKALDWAAVQGPASSGSTYVNSVRSLFTFHAALLIEAGRIADARRILSTLSPEAVSLNLKFKSATSKQHALAWIDETFESSVALFALCELSQQVVPARSVGTASGSFCDEAERALQAWMDAVEERLTTPDFGGPLYLAIEAEAIIQRAELDTKEAKIPACLKAAYLRGQRKAFHALAQNSRKWLADSKGQNMFADVLSTAPPEYRDRDAGLVMARRCVELTGSDYSRQSLRWALFRAARYQECVETLPEGSQDPMESDAVIAMALWHLGRRDEARQRFAGADERFDGFRKAYLHRWGEGMLSVPTLSQIERIHNEATELLGEADQQLSDSGASSDASATDAP